MCAWVSVSVGFLVKVGGSVVGWVSWSCMDGCVRGWVGGLVCGVCGVVGGIDK